MSGHRGQLKTAILPPWKSIRWFFNVNARLNVSTHKWDLYLTMPFSSLYLWFKLIWSSNNFLLSKFWPQYLQTCSENEVRILVFEKILHCANKLTWWASVFILGILISCEGNWEYRHFVLICERFWSFLSENLNLDNN